MDQKPQIQTLNLPYKVSSLDHEADESRMFTDLQRLLKDFILAEDIAKDRVRALQAALDAQPLRPRITADFHERWRIILHDLNSFLKGMYKEESMRRASNGVPLVGKGAGLFLFQNLSSSGDDTYRWFIGIFSGEERQTLPVSLIEVTHSVFSLPYQDSSWIRGFVGWLQQQGHVQSFIFTAPRAVV